MSDRDGRRGDGPKSGAHVAPVVPLGRVQGLLRGAAVDYDRERLGPNTPVSRSHLRHGRTKVACSRCGEPRMPYALVDGRCRSGRACDRTLNERCY